MPTDKQHDRMVAALATANFDESKHPRGGDGKFGSGGGGVSGDGPKAAKDIASKAKKDDKYQKLTGKIASGKKTSIKFEGKTIRQDADDGFFYFKEDTKLSDLKGTQTFLDRDVVDSYKAEFKNKVSKDKLDVGIVVSPGTKKFMVDDGHHRMNALRELGFKGTVVVKVRMPG